MTLDCEVVLTRSGAPAIRDRNTGEVMHPVVGPLVEALGLYVGPSRLEARLTHGRAVDTPLCVLDVGLGAASNATSALRVSESLPLTSRRLHVVSFDDSLGALECALAAPDPSAFGFEDEACRVAGTALLQRGRHETPRTTWELVQGSLPDTLDAVPPASADVVFWDPFSPKANPALWNHASFARVHSRCRPGATLHTYSGATAVRAALLLAGFAVGLGEPIGPGKQSTCAALDVSDLTTPLDARWLERLGRSSAPFPPDAPADALVRVAAMPQFAR